MATTPKGFRGTLGTGSTALWTVTGGATGIATSLVVCNKTGTDRTFTITADGVELFSAQPIRANATGIFDFRQVLAATKVIAGLASAGSAITYHLSGVEIS